MLIEKPYFVKVHEDGGYQVLGPGRLADEEDDSNCYPGTLQGALDAAAHRDQLNLEAACNDLKTCVLGLYRERGWEVGVVPADNVFTYVGRSGMERITGQKLEEAGIIQMLLGSYARRHARRCGYACSDAKFYRLTTAALLWAAEQENG